MEEVSLKLTDISWSSDWEGKEVGFDDVESVGLFTGYDENDNLYSFYLNYYSGQILELWLDNDLKP